MPDATPGGLPLPEDASASRRRFTALAALACGGVVGAAPLVPAVALLGDPLVPKQPKVESQPPFPDASGEAGRWVRVLPLDSLPADGVPRRFVLAADRQDAWTVLRDEPVGGVYLIRDSGERLRAITTVCPHLGCAVGYAVDQHKFTCPCHESLFALDGQREHGPSKRGLDSLPVQVHDGQVWVKFQRFRSTIAEKEVEG